MNLQDVVVREVRRDDYDQWLPLWDGYNAFDGRSGPTALPAEVTATTWARFFDADEPVHCLVAEQEQRLLGLAHFLFHRSTTAIGPSCYLQDLFISMDSRRQGVGRLLIGAIHVRAKAAGAARFYWCTHETNLAAQNLYAQIADRSEFIIYRKPI